MSTVEVQLFAENGTIYTVKVRQEDAQIISRDPSIAKTLLQKAIEQGAKPTGTWERAPQGIENPVSADNDLRSPVSKKSRQQHPSFHGLVNDLQNLSPYKSKRSLEPPSENEPVAMKIKRIPTSTVRITGMSTLVGVGEVRDFLDKTGILYGITMTGQDAVADIHQDFEEGETTFHVEFVSVKVARLMCSISPLYFECDTILLAQKCDTQQVPANVEKELEDIPTPFVRVYKVPTFFYEPHFRNRMNHTAWEMAVVNRPVEVIKAVTNYSQEHSSCTMEFLTQEIAKKFIEETCPLVYDKMTIQLVQEFALPASSWLTSFVEVENLPSFVCQPHFENFCNELVTSKATLTKGSKALKTIMDYNKEKRTCLLEFHTPEIASAFVSIEAVVYDRAPLCLMQVRGDLTSAPVLVSKLPCPFWEQHLENFINELAWLFDIVENDEVKAVSDYSREEHTCLVKFISRDVAERLCQLSPIVYENVDIHLELKQEKKGHEAVSSLGGKPLPEPEPSTTSSSVCIDDVLEKAACKFGQSAEGKLNADWDKERTHMFLNTYIAYLKGPKKSKGDLLLHEVRAHLWVANDLDYSVDQLREKMRSLKSYFNNTVMKTEAGRNGTSTYSHYNEMLEIVPLVKAQVEAQAEPSFRTSAAADGGPLSQTLNDKWDKSAILLLLAKYRERQSLFNAVDGTTRTIEVFKLVSSSMADESGRKFTPDQCRSKMSSLNSVFFTSKDFELNQTGAGSGCGLDAEVFAALEEIHAGSLATEAAVTYSFGAASQIKRGAIAPVKVLGPAIGTIKKVKKIWNWKTDSALTPQQQKLQIDGEKQKNAEEIQRETLKLLQELRRSREEREKRLSRPDEPK